MNTSNAIGFMAVGWLMKMIPVWAPNWFPPTGFDGANAQAIWFHAMGWIEIMVGGSYLLRHSVAPVLMAWATFRLPRGALDAPRAAVPVRV